MSKIGVISGRFDIAKKMVDKLVGDISIKELDHYNNSFGRYEVYFKNGDIYKALKPNESIRGQRFDKLYIHKPTVDEKFIKNVVPSICDNVEFFMI